MCLVHVCTMLRILVGTIFVLDICVWAQPSPDGEPGVPTENRCTDGGTCVPHYQCTANNTIITDGDGLINIRFSDDKRRECDDDLEICCRIGDIVTEPITPTGCGYRSVINLDSRITGEAQFAEFPWMVVILKEEQGYYLLQCGGSLIHPLVVLTAAHCIQDQRINTLKIRAGEWDTQTLSEIFPHQDRSIVDVIVHPQYWRRCLFNDIALIVLSTPVEFEKNVQTVCLPPQNAVFDHNRCTMSGWGKDVFGFEGKYHNILKKIELPVVPSDSCQNWLRLIRQDNQYNLHQSFICAGGEYGKGACNGDGGSPLVCPIQHESDRYFQSGIVAWSIKCGQDYTPGVYVNVALFRNWIDEQFALRQLNSSYYTAF